MVAAGYVGREDGNQLIDAYEFLRLLEHRLQLERFRRTHVLPEPDDTAALKWLAIIAGFSPLIVTLLGNGLWVHDHLTERKIPATSRKKIVELLLAFLDTGELHYFFA